MAVAKSLWLVGVLVSCSTACVPVYLPPVANAPLLGYVGETDVAVQGALFGYDLQGAFVPVEHVGIIGTASFNAGDAAHANAEVAAGYVTSFGGIGRFNAFAGGGGGKSQGKVTITVENASIDFIAKGNFVRAFAQADIGIVQRIVDVGLSVKAAYVHYNYTGTSWGQSVTSANNLFLEPFGFLRLGYEWLKAEFQVGYILPTRGEYPGSFPLNMSFGIHAKFNALGGDEPWGANKKEAPEPRIEAPAEVEPPVESPPAQPPAPKPDPDHPDAIDG